MHDVKAVTEAAIAVGMLVGNVSGPERVGNVDGSVGYVADDSLATCLKIAATSEVGDEKETIPLLNIFPSILTACSNILLVLRKIWCIYVHHV